MDRSRKVVCIGAGLQDVFLRGNIFKPHHEHGQLVEEFKLGTKQNVEGVVFTTGGGASNAAVTFARAGLYSCFMGRIGHDSAGSAVMDELHREDVDTSLARYTQDNTGLSVVLLAPDGERTILTYRGTSSAPDLHDSDLHHLDADWFYISSLDGDFATLERLINYAFENKTKVAINPGAAELARPEMLKNLLSKVELLCLNKEEMKQLFRAEHLEHLAQAAAILVPVVAVTDGSNGVAVCDGKQLIVAGLYEDVPALDRTGAGDAFASGFTAMIANGETLTRAVVFGSANATSVVGKIGAKAGILKRHANLHAMPMQLRERA